jgi:bifunctional enzyme CysN/CysC
MSYQLRQGPRGQSALVDRLDSQLNILSGTAESSRTLALNDIGTVHLLFPQSLPLVTFAEDRELGSFVLVNPTGTTAAVGFIETIHEGPISPVNASAPVIWLTGLSGAGKSTIAEALVPALRAVGVAAMHLDGDDLRTGLCSDLGFSPEDRQENIRRTAEVAKLFCQSGTVTICSLISPLRAHRDLARQIIGTSFREAFVKCDVEECIRRDPKGMYRRALAGSLPNFTGISAPYEEPESPEFTLDTETESASQLVQRLVQAISDILKQR